MRSIRCVWVVLFASMFSAVLLGQQGEQAGKPDQGKKAESGAAPQTQAAKPGPEMQKVTRMFVGRWQTETKMEPGPFAPQGGTAKGMSIIRRGPGGLSLIEDMRSRGAMGSFVGHGIMWWDAKDSEYKGFFCDNMMPAGCDVSGVGKWDGDKLVFSGETDAMGQKMSYREAYSDFTPGSFTFSMESATGGGEMKPAMTVKYTRVKREATKSAPETSPPAAPKQ